jgi:hypothetical protein
MDTQVIHAMGFFSNKKKGMIHAATWMKLESVILSERGHTHRHTPSGI